MLLETIWICVKNKKSNLVTKSIIIVLSAVTEMSVLLLILFIRGVGKKSIWRYIAIFHLYRFKMLIFN